MAEQHQNKARRNREVRDIFNKLRKKYTSEMVIAFIEDNYFITFTQVYHILSKVDDKPVDSPSLIHRTAMREDFHL